MNKNEYEKVIELNNIYAPLIKQAKKCQEFCKDKTTKFIWANNHYEKYANKFICEEYPIPIIEIQNIGDIGFNLNECFYEGYFKKEELLKFNFNYIKSFKSFSLYGEQNCLNDIYNSNMNFNKIKQLIEDSNENLIAINFSFKYKEIENVLKTLDLLTSN